MLLLANIPVVQLSAQGVLNEFSSENLRLSGIQLDVGVLGSTQLTGTTVGGLRLDFGRIAPRARLMLGLSYFKSEFDHDARSKFEVRLTNADRTRGFWTEPRDVTSGRERTVPGSLFSWPVGR